MGPFLPDWAEQETEKSYFICIRHIYFLRCCWNTHLLSSIGTISVTGFYHFPVSHRMIPRDHSVFQDADPQKNLLLVVYLEQTKPLFFFFFFSWLLQTTLSHWLFIRHNRNPVFYGWIHTTQNWHTREATLQLWNYHMQLDKKALFPKACDASREQYFAKKCFVFYTKYSGKLLVRQCANSCLRTVLLFNAFQVA